MAQATCSLCSRSANIACHNGTMASTDHVQQHPTKKRRVIRLSTVLEFHVDPDVHNSYATGATNKVSAEALKVIVDAVTKAEEMLQKHNNQVVASSAVTILPDQVNISTTTDSQMWTRQQ